jgi:hypothetical protein
MMSRFFNLRCPCILVAASALACAAEGAAESDRTGRDSLRADSVARARQDSIVRTQPGYVVDSAIPVQEALRRFRADIRDSATALAGGAPSREALVAAFARAVERGDSSALRRMAMTRAEFAYLVYPSSRYTRPPYRQQPEIVWLLLTGPSDKGLKRLVERRGGTAFRLVGHSCQAPPVTEGDNRVWRGCIVERARSPGNTTRERLFGPIIERDGQFKFYSYGNEL